MKLRQTTAKLRARCHESREWVVLERYVNMTHGTGSPNAVLANRKIRCIYVVLAIKIIICIYLCSCVFMSRFGRDLNPIREG